MTETALGTSENAKSNNLPHSSKTTQDTTISQDSGHTDHETKETE